mmetsp:Transcript_45600/g.74493  ORF Transcript_45600/g.74493 Transcript_45600/m.74493 type:complete len:114 (+) Transcript_45600:2198-2539(+)
MQRTECLGFRGLLRASGSRQDGPQVAGLLLFAIYAFHVVQQKFDSDLGTLFFFAAPVKWSIFMCAVLQLRDSALTLGSPNMSDPNRTQMRCGVGCMLDTSKGLLVVAAYWQPT